MENYRFLELAEKENGFEFYQAFRDEIDWIMGAKGDACWFVVMQDQSVKETYIGTRKDGVWTDRRIKGKGKRKTVKEMTPGQHHPARRGKGVLHAGRRMGQRQKTQARRGCASSLSLRLRHGR